MYMCIYDWFVNHYLLLMSETRVVVTVISEPWALSTF